MYLSARDEGARHEEEQGIIRVEVIQNSLHTEVPKQHLLWLVGMQVNTGPWLADNQSRDLDNELWLVFLLSPVGS